MNRLQGCNRWMDVGVHEYAQRNNFSGDEEGAKWMPIRYSVAIRYFLAAAGRLVSL